MWQWGAVLLAGALFGRLCRWSAPRLVDLEDRTPPFRGGWWELLNGLTFLWLWTQLGHEVSSLKWYVLAGLLLLLTATDFHTKLIPDRVTYPGAIAGILLSAIWPGDVTAFFHHASLGRWLGIQDPQALGAVVSVCGALAGFLSLELFRRCFGLLAGLEVIGMGDCKLLLMTGAFLGPEMVLFSVVPGVFCGLVLGTAYTWCVRTPHFPFGPALGLGALVALVYSTTLIRWITEASAWFVSLGPGLHLGLMIVLTILMILLVLRIRRRAAEYSRRIEEDYARLDRRPP